MSSIFKFVISDTLRPTEYVKVKIDLCFNLYFSQTIKLYSVFLLLIEFVMTDSIEIFLD